MFGAISELMCPTLVRFDTMLKNRNTFSMFPAPRRIRKVHSSIRRCDGVSFGCAERGMPTNPFEMSGGRTPGNGVPPCLTLGRPALASARAWVRGVQVSLGPVSRRNRRGLAVRATCGAQEGERSQRCGPSTRHPRCAKSRPRHAISDLV